MNSNFFDSKLPCETRNRLFIAFRLLATQNCSISISIVLTENNKFSNLCPDGKTRIFIVHKSSVKLHKKTYDYENNKKTGKNQKFRTKGREASVEAI